MTLLSLTLLPFVTLQAQNKEPSNLHFWHTIETTASPQQIWAIWTDVANWKEWDTGLKDAEMQEDFSLQSEGIIISLEGRKSKFTVVEYEAGHSYTYRTRLPLGSLYVKRSLTTQGSQTVFTHEVWFSGLSKRLFAKAFGGTFREMLPNVLQNIKELAEE